MRTCLSLILLFTSLLLVRGEGNGRGRDPGPLEQPEPPRLKAVELRTNGWFRLGLTAVKRAVYEIERSSDLQSWSTVAVLHGREDGQTNAHPFLDTSAGPARSFTAFAPGP